MEEQEGRRCYRYPDRWRFSSVFPAIERTAAAIRRFGFRGRRLRVRDCVGVWERDSSPAGAIAR